MNNLTSIGSITGSLVSSSLNANGLLTIGGLASTTGISISKPLTLTSPLTLGSGATGDSQLGYTLFLNLTATTAAVITSTSTTLFTTPSLSAGVWGISYGTRIGSASGTITANDFITFIQGSPAPPNTGGGIFGQSGGGITLTTMQASVSTNAYTNGSVIVKTTASTVFFLRYYLTSTSAINFITGSTYLTVTRIA